MEQPVLVALALVAAAVAAAAVPRGELDFAAGFLLGACVSALLAGLQQLVEEARRR